MARALKAPKTSTPAAAKPKIGRPKKEPAPAPATASKAVAALPAPAPKLSKDELRALVEKLERTVSTLRAKGREASKAAKASASRIAELEAQVSPVNAAASEAAPASVAAGPSKKAPSKRKFRAPASVEGSADEPGSPGAEGEGAP